MKVLLCENEDVTRAAIEFRLTRQGHEVLRAKTGKEAQNLIETNDFALLLVDMALGKSLSTPDLVRWIRQEKDSLMPIILIADLEEDADAILDALTSGANDFITKPFKPVELQLRIRRIV
jgi:two-component system, OmpR family, response regulator VicR